MFFSDRGSSEEIWGTESGVYGQGESIYKQEILGVFRGIGGKEQFWGKRFWRTYKYECLYLSEVRDLRGLKELTKEWVRYYNSERVHQALGYRTPDEVYYGKEIVNFTKRC